MVHLGGPYTVTVSKAGYAEANATGVFTKFSETSSVDVFLAAEFEEVVVSAFVEFLNWQWY